MIVTITPAPAIDWTITVDRFDLDGVNRIASGRREASGKGLNVSWALHRAGIATRAVFPAGAETGAFLRRSLTDAGLEHVTIDTGRDVRTNITLVSPGHSTKLNEPGTPLDASHAAALRRAALDASEGAQQVLVCGSLPAGLDATFQRDLVRELHARGVPFVGVDASGAPLRTVLDARPDLIKPNTDELAELTGRVLRTFGDVERAARDVLAQGQGPAAVLASLGADGTLLVRADSTLWARAERIPFVNSVGAGDALLAGFVARGDAPDADRLRNAVLWASSAVAHDTTIFTVRDEFAPRITVDAHLPADTPLREPATP